MAFPHKREKIAGTVRKWIDDGKFQPGDRFPSDQELARKFKVTHITVRSAIQPLVEAGILERRIGFGTLVRKPRPKGEAEPETGALGNAVAVAIPANTMSFFSDVLKGIEAALFATGRPFLLGHHWELGDREDALVRSWTRQGLRRAILVPLGGREAFYRELLAAGVRLVFVDRTVAGVDVPSVSSRDHDGSARLTKLLIDLGHRRPVHLAGPAHASTADARTAGFEATCQAAGVAARVIPGGFFMEDGYLATTALLSSGDTVPDAIFAANDSAAVGVLRALAEKGLEVPGDVSVAGYGDTDLGRNFNLTTVRQFPERMGAEAVQLLLAPRPLTSADAIELDAEIVVRSSTAAR
jgi:LacI family transcriptional regulator